MTKLQYAALLIQWFGYEFAKTAPQLEGYEEEIEFCKGKTNEELYTLVNTD